MASNRGYTTAQKVRDVMAGQVITYITDAMIETFINRMEAIIDVKLKIGNAGTGATTPFTWTTADVPQWVLEGAATYGAALACCGPSAASWNSTNQLANAQNVFAFMLKMYMDCIDSEDFGAFILETV